MARPLLYLRPEAGMQYRQTPAQRELQRMRMEIRRRNSGEITAAEPAPIRGAWLLYWTGMAAVLYALYTLYTLS